MTEAFSLGDAEGFYRILREGSPENWRDLLKLLPETGAEAEAAAILEQHGPAAPILALTPIAVSLCEYGDPALGRLVAFATHRYAVELFEKRKDHAGLAPKGLMILAAEYVRACNRMSDNDGARSFLEEWAPFYKQLGMLDTLEKHVAGDFGRAVRQGPGVGITTREPDDVMPREPPRSKARPPDKPLPPASIGRSTAEFDLGVETRKPPSAAPPPARRIVSTGFADPANPGVFRSVQAPLAVNTRYYYGFEIGAPVPGAMDQEQAPIPEHIPAGAELVVVLFAPAGGFALDPQHATGRVRMREDGTAEVVAQPDASDKQVPKTYAKRRLFFPVRTPADVGTHRLRSSVYWQGVLVQSRLITAAVGQEPPEHERAVASTLDYTLSGNLSPATLASLESHDVSVMMNQGPNGTHDFYFFSEKPKQRLHSAATVSASTLGGLITQARVALQMTSWEKDGEKGGDWDKSKTYRYAKAPSLDQLRLDLVLMASRGYDIYDAIAENLAGDKDVAVLEETLKSPGRLQIAGKADIRFVLPAGLIYDYAMDSQLDDDTFTLCPAFVTAYKDQTDILKTPCFQGACPSRGKNSVICPSGFWGFRHAIGLPISVAGPKPDTETDDGVEIAARIRYKGDPVMVVGVSTAPDLTERAKHTGLLQALQLAWQEPVWSLGQTRADVLKFLAGRNPHLVYFYCHGGTKDQEGLKIPYLSVGAPAEEVIIRATLRQAQVRWPDSRPLVFINGCHTTALDPDAALDFVTGFVQQARACGVIGTEITVFEPLACDFAMAFWKRFITGEQVGKAIQLARLDLLMKGNPLGLVYTPFVFAGTKLEKIA